MSVEIIDFITTFPEFTEAGDPMIQARLDQAARETPTSVWGEHTDKGIMLRAADALSRGPGGTNAQIEPEKLTSYAVELKRYINIVTCGRVRVI